MKKLTLINIRWSRGQWVGFVYLPLSKNGSPILNILEFCKATGFDIPNNKTFTIS